MPVTLNSAPGLDRAQFFPWISTGADGGLDAIWYDQRAGIEGSDLTDVLATHSEDGGLTWSCPVSLLAEPFHAEYGQDTGQPNIGDYNQCASRVTAGVRRMFASYARTDAADHLTTAPDTYVGMLDPATAAVSLTPDEVIVADIGCTADQTLVAGEIGDLTVSLQNACTGAVSGISGTLAALSAGVSVLQADAAFPDLAPGTSGSSASPFRMRLADAYPCGDPIRLRLDGTSNSGVFGFTFTVPTVGTNPLRQDLVHLAWIDLVYRRELNADGKAGELDVDAGEAGRTVRVTRPPAGTLVVLDVTDPRNPRELTGGVVAGSGTTATLEFAMDRAGSAVVAFVPASGVPVPAKVSLKTSPRLRPGGSDVRWLRDTREPIDYVIIAYDDFAEEAEILAAWRRANLYEITDTREARVREVEGNGGPGKTRGGEPVIGKPEIGAETEMAALQFIADLLHPLLKHGAPDRQIKIAHAQIEQTLGWPPGPHPA